jgi:adenosylmethionine-8-amino-7-oxononanoate aminotransferase
MASFDAAARTFVRAHGTTLVDARGHEVFDAISSVWTTVHGHGHPAIVAAIAQQARELDHVTALGGDNPVAQELAARLCTLTSCSRVMFASDGASAVEAALKMAVQYWQNVGEPQRTRFIRLRDAYHGDTVGAMAVSDIALFKERFAAIIIESLCYDDAAEVLGRGDIAAVIVEPVVQAAAGMRIVPDASYAALRAPRVPLLIVDEIATGFGRTGTMFAFQQLAVEPDIITLGKGLSGGTLPLSATLASERVYDAFLGDYAEGRHFFHGHSYAGNPIACAAALASLDLFASEATLETVARTDAALDAVLAPLLAHSLVRDVRRRGLMIGIEVVAEDIAASDAPTPAWRIANDLYARGHFTRPIGATLQLVPPLVATLPELHSFVDALVAALDSVSP